MTKTKATNKTLYVASVDIINSTQRENEIGSEEYDIERDHFLTIVAQIATYFKSQKPQNPTDGYSLYFEDVKQFLLFISATNHLNSVDQSSSFPLKVRLAGACGLITERDGKKSGLPINLTARLDSHAIKPLVTSEVVEGLIELQGKKAKRFFEIMDEPIDLKGFPESPVCYWFDGEKYAEAHPKETFHNLAYKYLEGAGVVFSNIQPEDLLTPGKLVFPIVPRSKINLIHAGLIQVARIFSILNWEIEILVADIALDDRVNFFKDKIQTALEKEKVKIKEGSVQRLSEFVKGNSKKCCCPDSPRPQNACCEITHGHLFGYMEGASIEDVEKALEKKGEKRSSDKKYLASLRPLFTWATVKHLYKDTKCKVAVLAGADERKLWEDLPFEDIASVHIPTIDKNKGKKQFIQTPNRDFLTWLSDEACIDAMEGTNIRNWGSKIIYRLNQFPDKSITLPKRVDSINKKKLATLIREKQNKYNSR